MADRYDVHGLTATQVACIFFTVVCNLLLPAVHSLQWDNQLTVAPPITGLKFLITVNATDDGCMSTSATPMLTPGHKSQSVHVGHCDRGPIYFNISQNTSPYSYFTVYIKFYSSVIEDADPPECQIPWNGTYLVPDVPFTAKQDLLPVCFVQDSREGWHLTYYWFHIMEWTTN